MRALSVPAILRRWDAIAHAQLVEHAARLAVENEELSERARWAEDAAESWRDDFLRLCEDTRQSPGITIDGHLVAVPGESANA